MPKTEYSGQWNSNNQRAADREWETGWELQKDTDRERERAREIEGERGLKMCLWLRCDGFFSRRCDNSSSEVKVKLETQSLTFGLTGNA